MCYLDQEKSRVDDLIDSLLNLLNICMLFMHAHRLSNIVFNLLFIITNLSTTINKNNKKYEEEEKFGVT